MTLENKGEWKAEAIVYTSQTGHTGKYAKILGEKTGLQVYNLKEAAKELDRGTRIIYLGWLFANSIKGYKKANRLFNISAICAVGLGDTGTGVAEVRKRNSLPESTPLFTMQGGIDRSKLRGFHKLMIKMLTKGLTSQKNPSEQDKRMLELLTHENHLVSEENTVAFMEWYVSERICKSVH